MKYVFAMLIALSSTAFAVSKNSSWDKIFKAENVRYNPQHVEGLYGVDFSNACITDTEVKSIKPVSVCTEWAKVTLGSDSGAAIVCKKSKKQQVTYTRKHDMKTCDQFKEVSDESGQRMECVKRSTETMDMPNSIAVNVWEVRGEESTYPGFSKDFTFPKCN